MPQTRERQWPVNSSMKATILRDGGTLLAIRQLQEPDVLVLLTPFALPVATNPTDLRDPFELFGRALEKRHCRIRQVPYTDVGLTGIHVGFFQRASAVIFVVNSGTARGPHVPVDFAHVARVLLQGKPFVLVVTCNIEELGGLEVHFPTAIQSQGYTGVALESVASLIFGDVGTQPGVAVHPPPLQLAPIQPFLETRDLRQVHELWHLILPPRFKIDIHTLASVLYREGYSKHHVVRNDEYGLLGFCATYLTFIDPAGDKLLASIAVLFVHPGYRNRGIGLGILKHAIEQLRRTHGIVRFELGSTFPRLLSGPPIELQESGRWFIKGGWPAYDEAPSHYDLTLDLRNLQVIVAPNLHPIVFRPATAHDMGQVLKFVTECCDRENHMGWFDQYSRLLNDVNLRDIMLAHNSQAVVAAALTYTPDCGSPISEDIPWPKQLGRDVGGVSCICVGPVDRTEMLLQGLLIACARKLKGEGMMMMYVDAISRHLEMYERMGFKEWSRYSTVIKDV